MKEYFSKFKRMNWKFIALFAVAVFYFGIFVISENDKNSPIHYGGDYLAFWSAGKVADESGFSEIYDLEKLRAVQAQELRSRGFLTDAKGFSFLTLPAPFLSFFILPFGLLSRLELTHSYWLWLILNLVVLISYLVFFLRKIRPEKELPISVLYLLALAVFSFPVFDNLINGQLNILMLVCMGEFIRTAISHRPMKSGMWLAGLLLKPQLLILIIPFLLFRRSWKILIGFLISSGIITLISIALSGVDGSLALIKLWTTWGESNAITAPTAMINWRMVGVYLNELTSSSIGWVIAGLGIVSTLIVVFFIIKFMP